MNIVIIDGQGGQLGSQLVKGILANCSDVKITAVGTNAVATAAMLKAGAHQAAARASDTKPHVGVHLPTKHHTSAQQADIAEHPWHAPTDCPSSRHQ